MANVFNQPQNEQSVVDIVKESLDVDSEGNVSFRSRKGKGSGKAIEIPAEQFDAFVDVMNRARDVREDIARKQQTQTLD